MKKLFLMAVMLVSIVSTQAQKWQPDHDGYVEAETRILSSYKGPTIFNQLLQFYYNGKLMNKYACTFKPIVKKCQVHIIVQMDISLDIIQQ